MQDFHQRLKAFIQESPYDYKSLSLEIGQGERYISNLLSTKSDPGYSSVVKICSALGITPNQIAGLNDQISLAGGEIDNRIVTAQAERILTAVTREAHRKLNQRGARPLLDDVLTWWHQQRGKLANFDALSEHVDLYRAPEPDSRLPEPFKIGAQSLAAQSFGIQTAEHLQYLFTTFDGKLTESVRLAHVEASHGDPQLSIQEIDVMLPGHSFPLRFTYKRLLLPVEDADGNKYVLNYSQALE
ncbi:helix-turn-helix domain-containing protein [Roseovarius aestuariivivens]|uniref:helix-turn-helix domain-containing protein n=1 Tax=Roseovarius aestuariivivens TaxID=1888910 RepID=UPI0010816DBC|nr:helix-turn-helix transcriptional regulator [Roseovarius aestuariivivens]